MAGRAPGFHRLGSQSCLSIAVVYRRLRLIQQLFDKPLSHQDVTCDVLRLCRKDMIQFAHDDWQNDCAA
jgi:hypothetical protein